MLPIVIVPTLKEDTTVLVQMATFWDPTMCVKVGYCKESHNHYYISQQIWILKGNMKFDQKFFMPEER